LDIRKTAFFLSLAGLVVLISAGVSTGICEKKVPDIIPENGTDYFVTGT